MAQNDPLAAKSEPGLCGHLHTATLCTNDLDNIKKFYVEGMGLTIHGPISFTAEQKEVQRKIWDIPDDLFYSYYHLTRTAVPSLVQIRLLVFDQDTPSMHKSYSSLELGPFSLGFPNLNEKALDKKLYALGIESMAPLQIGEIKKADGSSYNYLETIFKGPDYLHCVGIQRDSGMPQVSPCDPETELGGPGYSAQVITDSDNFMSFLQEVLDLELRQDWYWEASPGSALGLPEGTPFRFMLVYAKAATQNHFLFLDFKESKMIDTGIEPRIPNKGLGAWTIETKNISEIKSRAEKFGAKIISEPLQYDSPIYGKAKVMTFLAPNNFLIEVFEKL